MIPPVVFVLLSREDDFIAVYNRYPDTIRRVSIVQYERYRVGFNEKVGHVTILSNRDMFGIKVINNEEKEELNF